MKEKAGREINVLIVANSQFLMGNAETVALHMDSNKLLRMLIT